MNSSTFTTRIGERRFAPSGGKHPLYRRLNRWGMRSAAHLGAGLHRLFGARTGESFGILMYHRVWPCVPGLPQPAHNVSPDAMFDQFSGLLKRGYTAWPLRRALEATRTGDVPPPNTFVVTFDDGFENFYTSAWPILRELSIPATIFLNTAYLDSDAPMPCDPWGSRHEGFAPVGSYRPLASGQCEALLASGLIELGAHTHTHQDFRGRPDEFRDDLRENLRELRWRFGIESPTFAYPYGTVHSDFMGPELAAVVRELGVRCALSTEGVPVRRGSDPFTWGRFNVASWDTAATLAAKLAGWYSWAPRLRQDAARRFRGWRHAGGAR